MLLTLVLICSICCCFITLTRAVKLLPLQPLKTIGTYLTYKSSAAVIGGETTTVEQSVKKCCFLSRPNLEVIDSKDGSDGDDEDESRAQMVLIDILPIPLADSREESLVYASLKAMAATSFLYDDNSVLVLLLNKDGGIFDNLPYAWAPSPLSAKKDLYDSFQISGGLKNNANKSCMGLFIDAFQERLKCTITGLLIEADYSDDESESVTFCGAVILARRSSSVDVGEWRLSSSSTALPQKLSNDEDVIDADACLMYVNLHELVSMSLETRLPIFMPDTLYNSASIDGTLCSINGDMTIAAKAPRRVFKSMIKKNNNDKSNNSDFTPVWEIYDARRFLSMTAAQKRSLLRGSGVGNLPRPLQGAAALDQVLLTWMDESVKGEYLRLVSRGSNMTEGAEAAAAAAAAISSPRQHLLQQMAMALEQGDVALAQTLREEFATLTALRADPTQAKGSYDPYLDQDDWYMQERRKAMR